MNVLKESLWKQFGASINMLENAMILVPEAHWNTDKRFFYQCYHCLIFLDYYLTIPVKNFSSQLPFRISETDEQVDGAIGDVIPERIYSKSELLHYLLSCREKCRHVIESLTEEKLEERWIEEDGDMDYAVLEILLYNLRHVQHHAAQVNLLLRQEINNAPGWVSRAD